MKYNPISIPRALAFALAPMCSSCILYSSSFTSRRREALPKPRRFSTLLTMSGPDGPSSSADNKIIDSHLHVWASPEEAADKYHYFPGQEPTLQGDVDFFLQGLSLHNAEIKELCSEFPSTTVLLDHVAFCKPPSNDEESRASFSELLKLSRFQQVNVKFSALFRVSRMQFPYTDLSDKVSLLLSRSAAIKEAISLVGEKAQVTPSDMGVKQSANYFLVIGCNNNKTSFNRALK